MQMNNEQLVTFLLSQAAAFAAMNVTVSLAAVRNYFDRSLERFGMPATRSLAVELSENRREVTLRASVGGMELSSTSSVWLRNRRD